MTEAVKPLGRRQATGLMEALTIQFRVVGALLLREILTRYGRHNIGFAWLFAEPMLFTLGITALWSATKATHGSDLPIVAFAVTGYSSVLLWRNAANRCAKALQPNLGLLYHRNVRATDIFYARIILEIAGATISFAALIAVFVGVDWMLWPSDFLMMLEAWLLLAIFAVGIGLTVGSLTEMSDPFDRVWHAITYLLFPLSGAMYMVDWLPKVAQDAVLWLPMVHATEMLRHGYFGNSVRTLESPGYLALADLVMLYVGLILARRASETVEPE